MKKTASKSKLVADTVAKLKEAQTATQEKVAELAAMRISCAPTIDAQAESVTHYLDHAAKDALERARHIVPSIADVAAHPLPAWKDLITTPVSRRTLAEVTNEITDYLADEYRFAAPGMMHGLEDFIVWYQGCFLEALRRLTEQKIATAETLGKTNAKKKFVEAFASLPSFPSPEAFEDYCQRICKSDTSDPTDEIVLQWRKGKPSHFPAPDAFKAAFRRALMLDAEATAEINGYGQTAAPCGFTAKDRAALEQAEEYARQAATKTKRELEAKSRGGKKSAKTRKEEATTDPTKETIRREVNKLKAQWDTLYPNRHRPGNKDHSNNQIYRIVANKHLNANGKPLYSWETIKSMFTHPKRAKKNGNK